MSKLYNDNSETIGGTPLVKELCRRCKIYDNPEAVRYLVVFKTDKELPLIGAGESPE